MLKLLTVLDKDILCDDYYRFVLEQEEKLKLLVEKCGLRKLARMIGIGASSLDRWNKNLMISTFLSNRYHQNKFYSRLYLNYL
ncbi:hypothetical protein [Clostridium oryzae]|uniref:hypothetical protein n=1 Tax=Clostridium oryzae TaxID=1450648 RepID=UPI0011167E7B|nr:hypothetical protein [Clostridium oryzae]